MAARRETRRDHEAFMARLEGRDFEERQRLSTEHRAYLSGERDTDADFGSSTETAEAIAAMPTASRPPASLRPRLIPAPPRGKNASYLANAQRLMETRLPAEAALQKTTSGKKKITKRQEAAIRRGEKNAKEARAMARAAGAAAARSAAKEKHRAIVAAEEERGSEARQAALSQLQQKKASTSKATTKRKAVAKPDVIATKKQKKTSSHVTVPEDEADADDESVVSSVEVILRELSASESSDAGKSASNPPRQTVRTLSMISADGEVAEEAADPSDAPDAYSLDGDVLNSDVEGDANPEDWYTEVGAADMDCGGAAEGIIESATPTDMERDAADDLSAESDGEVDGNAFLRREKNRAKRQREKDLLEAAKAKLSRDWERTMDKWDKLTKEEMEVLALDQAALKKLRADGWNFDSATQPQQTEPYPGLYSGECGPTDEVLEFAESPLQLFFYFMPPRLWRRIATESNRYYIQNLNARVDRMYAAQQARGDEGDRADVLLRETKRHTRIQPEDVVHCIGLLVARMLCPHKRRFADHWATTPTGAVPKGTFGSFVRKSRFDQIMQNLHFTNNADAQAETDRAWKVRSVVETLQKTFASGFKVLPVLAFDEAMIPSRSRHNVTRQFMKDKPHLT